jgi:hypothetical protein
MNATRLAPSCLIDFLSVADCQASGRFRCHEDRITHFPTRTTVLGLNFLPESKASKFEFRKFFLDLPAQAIFIAFSRPLATSGKHPLAIALSSDEKHPSAFRSHQFRGLRHSLYADVTQTTPNHCAHARRACVGDQAECAEHGAGPCAWCRTIGHWSVLGC